VTLTSASGDSLFRPLPNRPFGAYAQLVVPSTSEQGLPQARQVRVAELLAEEPLAQIAELLAGAEGTERMLTHPRVQKNGLALVGHATGIVPTRVQVLGQTEVSYLTQLPPDERLERLRFFLGMKLSLLVVTRGVAPPAELLEVASATQTPLVLMPQRSSRAIQLLHASMDRLLSPQCTVHGVLVDVHGIGVLLMGPSGVGKSECALFLVERGHRLVADDQVMLRLLADDRIAGRPPPLLRHHLEVRGIGIINVRDLFGATAVRGECAVDLVVELSHYSDNADYDRLGLDDQSHDLLGIQVPALEIPVHPGRDMAVLLEVAARNQLLKRAGHHAARRFVETLSGALGVPEDPDA